MAARGYASQALVEGELGTALTAAQATYSATLFELAEREIDLITGRTWLGGAITGEPHYDLRGADPCRGTDLYLRVYPVATVQSVTVRGSLGDAETTLVAGTDYELRDGASGWIRFPDRRWDERALVSYTPTDAAALVSDDGKLVQRAATLLVADWLRPVLSPGTAGIQSYSVGQDLSVTFRNTSRAVPPSVLDLLSLLRDRRTG